MLAAWEKPDRCLDTACGDTKGMVSTNLQILFDWIRTPIIQNVDCQLFWGVVDVKSALHNRAVQRPRLLIPRQKDVNLKHRAVHLKGSAQEL